MEEKKPLVSIITVCLNSEKHIEQAILSVINQNYSPIEYIIIDGESTDGTLDIIKKYQNKISQIVSEKDAGIYDAMNKGIQKANGEIIGIINSDDWYDKDAVEKIVNKYLSTDRLGVIHGDLAVWDSNKIINIKKPNLSNKSKVDFAYHPTCFVPKILYNKFGFFEDKYKIVGDVDLLLRLKKNNVNFYYIPQTIANFRLGGASDKIWKNIEESWKIYKKHFSFFTACKLLYKRTIVRQANETIKKLFGERIRKKISRAYHFIIRK